MDEYLKTFRLLQSSIPLFLEDDPNWEERYRRKLWNAHFGQVVTLDESSGFKEGEIAVLTCWK